MKIHLQKRRGSVGLGLYILLILILTLSPFEFSGRWLQALLEFRGTTIVGSLFYISFRDMVLNVLFFIPVGAFLRGLELNDKHSRKRILHPIVLGLVLSGSIEGLQLFLIRSSTLTDLIANTAGCIAGYLLHEPVFRITLYALFRWIRQSRAVRVLSLFLYVVLLLWFVFLPLRMNNLEGWQETYPLCVGNENTGDRPWQGELRFVTVYGRALRTADIRDLHDNFVVEINNGQSGSSEQTDTGKGLSSNNQSHRAMLDLGISRRQNLDGLIYYYFKSNMDSVPDLFGLERPLYPAIGGPSRAASPDPREVSRHTFLKTGDPATQLVKKIQEKPFFSIEVALRTENMVQRGPARIVTVSESPDARNFTLGQEERALVFRVRSPLAGPNGSRIRIRSDQVMEAGEWHHIVAVFNRGYERIFVDGKARRGSIRADLSYLPAIVGLGKNIAAQIALGLLFIIPLSFLLTDVLPHRFRVFGPIVVAGLIISIQIVYHLQVDQSLSWATILISTLIALGSTWFASGSYGESSE